MSHAFRSIISRRLSFSYYYNDFYVYQNILDTDLHNVIKRGNILKEVHKQYILYQLFRATKYLHSGNVIHRDQKVRTSSLICKPLKLFKF